MSPYPLSAYGPPPGPPPSDDTLGWAGVAASVLSWLLCCCTPIPFVGLLANVAALLLSLVGVICGGLAYRQATQRGGRTDLALIALLVGGLRLLVIGALFAVFVVVVAVVGMAGVSEYLQNLGH
jgi:hypothetical protein